jgi:Flp pilus assembly protein TadD
LNLGEFYNSVGRPAEAVPHLLEAVRLRPGDASPYVNVGQSYYLLERNDLAGELFSKALRLKPGDGITLNNLARIRFVDGEISESIRLYEAAIAAIPEFPDAQRRLAVALLLAGRTAAARGHLERATVQAPEDETARELLRGLVAFERNPDDPAAAGFRRELAGAHREAGRALQARGKKGDAAAHLDRALALVPSFLEARVDRGVLLMEEGRLEEAAAEFRKALKIAPGAPLVHNNLGYVLEQMGRREDAIAEYREALRLHPGFPLAEANLQNALKNAQPR